MAHIGTGVEYALHCLLWLVSPLEQRPSSRDLAELQGVPAAFVAKIFSKLEKAGIVESSGGIRGGYQLARAPEDISVLDVVDAVEGPKALFDCQEIRGRCALFEERPPAWASRGVCGIHAVMINAQKAMREELARSNLASIAEGVQAKGRPASFAGDVQDWFADRQVAREEARITGMRSRASAPDED
ncbi:Rrf2 family transcriptional regulator [Stenotrophomonas sp. 24(2023)]|uniref:RrF2 family transcriptional regulator n=1 Tax=Stenotrophomonas sp. 24(2023) TaxID=3068324 RepID=UPI0027DF57AE|nr:Rrf2 family transcriptional regulator [Stenotrophomonas sp. 24(2023)]WMJ68631.1 Rrf2 family transcriptional regulator [Stenotrophomonas sp. 24(2023)]